MGGIGSKQSINETPIPKKQLFVLWTMLLCDSLALTQLFPYVAFLVQDFHMTDDPSKIGYYAGFLMSSFAFAQFLSSYWWGKLADKYGRRWTLLGGMIGTVFATSFILFRLFKNSIADERRNTPLIFLLQLSFGLSTSYYWAMGSRFIHGLLNGNVGITKTYLAEITDESNKPRAFIVLNLAGSAGRIVGMMVGGLLSNPAEKYPTVFAEDGLFGHFPYLLPCLVSVSLSLVGISSGYFFLEETLKKDHMKLINENEQIELNTIKKDENNTENSTALELIEEEQNNSGKVSGSKKLDLTRSKEGEDYDIKLDIEEDMTLDDIKFEIKEKRCCKSNPFKKAYMKVCGPQSILSRKVLITLTQFGLLVLNINMFDETFSLLILGSPEQGGLGFKSSQIGIAQSAAAFVLLFYQLFLFPVIAKKLSPLITFRVGMALSLPIMFFFPFVANLHDNIVLAWVVLMGLLLMRYCFSTSAFTSNNIMVSNSAPNDKLGRVNGLGQSVAAFSRMIGPISAGSLFAWSLSAGLPFPFDFHLVYILMTTLVTCNFCLSFMLDSSINKSYKK